MSAKKYDFSIEQGTSFRLAITYKDKDQQIINISDYCARLIWITDKGVSQVFTTENTDLSLYKFSVDGPTGKLMLLLPASTTNNFDFTFAQYDLELRSNIDLYSGGGKEVSRLLYGKITLIKRNSKVSTEIACS